MQAPIMPALPSPVHWDDHREDDALTSPYTGLTTGRTDALPSPVHWADQGEDGHRNHDYSQAACSFTVRKLLLDSAIRNLSSHLGF